MAQIEDTSFQKRYGPYAMVAGASEGLGAEFAEQLARRGLNLVLIARRQVLLDSLASRLSSEYLVEVRPLSLDLASPDAIVQIASYTQALEVGLLIYNAAFSAIGPFLDIPIEDHLKELDTNVRTPMQLAYLFGPRLVARRNGGMILMSSLSAFQGSAFIAHYTATKAYNQLLAEGLWEEWRSLGVDVLVCMAGAVRTPNYLASTPKQAGVFNATIEPRQVVSDTLAALGRQPYVIPGPGNRLASFVMRYLLPRRVAIQFMGRVLHSLYSD